MDAEALAKCSENTEEGVVNWAVWETSWRRRQMGYVLREKSCFDRGHYDQADLRHYS